MLGNRSIRGQRFRWRISGNGRRILHGRKWATLRRAERPKRQTESGWKNSRDTGKARIPSKSRSLQSGRPARIWKHSYLKQTAENEWAGLCCEIKTGLGSLDPWPYLNLLAKCADELVLNWPSRISESNEGRIHECSAARSNGTGRHPHVLLLVLCERYVWMYGAKLLWKPNKIIVPPKNKKLTWISSSLFVRESGRTQLPSDRSLLPFIVINY